MIRVFPYFKQIRYWAVMKFVIILVSQIMFCCVIEGLANVDNVEGSTHLNCFIITLVSRLKYVLEVANAKDRNVSGCYWNDRKSLWCDNARCCRPNLRACNRACTQGANREDVEGSPLWLLKFSRTLHDSYDGFASSGEGSAKDRDTTGCYWNDRKSLWCGNARCCKPNKRACNKVCV